MSRYSYAFECGHTTLCEYVMPSLSKTQSFTIVYTHGFCSDPWGRKPEEIKKWCSLHNIGFFRYEIAGHGSDAVHFTDTTINTYKTQLFEIIEKVISGPIVVIGASLGGWLALLAACAYPSRIQGFVGLAAAPDFLKTYFENNFTPYYQNLIKEHGQIEFTVDDFTYTITQKMLDSVQGNLLLENDIIPYKGKVRLLQGLNDASLDWHTALTIAQKLETTDVQLRLMKSSNHHLGCDDDIHAIYQILDDFLIKNDG